MDTSFAVVAIWRLRFPSPSVMPAKWFNASLCISSSWKKTRWGEVTQPCPTLSDPTDCSLPGSSIHGIFQARVLEWVAITYLARCRHYIFAIHFLRGYLCEKMLCSCYWQHVQLHCSSPVHLYNNVSEIVSAFLEIFCERFLERTYRGPPGFLIFCPHLAGDHPQNLMSLSCRVLSLALNYAYMDMFLREGNGNSLQCSCLENPRDRGTWWAAVYGITQSRTQLSSSSSRTCFSSLFLSSIFLTGSFPEVPNLQDLTPGDLRWSWCNNNRNKGHSKCNVLELSWTHPPPLGCGEIVFQEPGPWCQKGWGPTVYIIQTTKFSALHFMKK